MRGGDSAKSFLEKLKLGGAAGASVDNNAPPDIDGIIVRRLERQYTSEPLSALGLRLSEDGEVLSTEANSPAAKANILPHYMILYVNNQFVGSRVDFEDLATQHLTLIVKLQSTGAMSELLAKILDEEEKMGGENGNMAIDTNELLRTTPRYGFLSAEHPMFLRWDHRLQKQREARQLIRQATRDAEEQQAKKAFEQIRREMEAEEARQQEERRRRQQQEQQQLLQQQHHIATSDKIFQPAAPRQMHEEEFHVKQVQDESAFGRANDVTEEFPAVSEEASPEELLKLIGAKPRESEVAPQSTLPEDDGEVRFFIIPTEEYTLSNGTRVIISVKQRSGPLPTPPPGKPPKGIRALRLNNAKSVINPVRNGNSDVTCSFCYMRGHNERDCVEKREQERKLALAPKERQVCRDFLRGRCTRSDCMMKHISQSNRDRSPRARKRDHDGRRESRDRYHRRGSRRRRHDDRHRRQRSESFERYRRRR